MLFSIVLCIGIKEFIYTDMNIIGSNGEDIEISILSILEPFPNNNYIIIKDGKLFFLLTE